MDDQTTTDQIKANVKDTNVWIRLLFMLMFTVIYSATEFVIAISVIFQFLTVLFTGKKNENVLSFGAQLSTYAYQIFRFLTFNSETKPFPLGDWPSNQRLSAQTEAVKPKRAPRKTATKKTTPRKTTAKKAAPKPEKADEKPTEDSSSPA